MKFANEVLVAAVMLIASSAAVRAGDAPASQPTTQAAVDPTPVNKLCAVQGTDPIDPKITVVYKGKTYGFCCSDCVAIFQKNPEKYAAGVK